MRGYFLAFAVLVVALSAAGCGGDSGGSESAGSTTSPASTPATTSKTTTEATTTSKTTTEATTTTGPATTSKTTTEATTTTGSSAGPPQPVVAATLSGGAETGKGSPTGSGTARVTLNVATRRACWTLTVKGIDKPLSAHIHKGQPDMTGPVVIPLGDVFKPKGCVLMRKKELTEVSEDPGAYYVNVHTKKYLNGAIRGQLHGT